MQTEWQDEAQALAEDHLSPSSALATRASEMLQQVAESEPQALEKAARSVVRAQPAMAALANVANVALRALETLGAESVRPALQALARVIDADRKEAASALCDRIESPVRVVTTSASANVVEALQALRDADRLLGVVCGESRPLLEGTALARWLADQDYPVTLVCDAALAEHLVSGSVLLVGADAVLPHAIANKRGTRLYASWARLAHVERYVLATRDKLYPPELESLFANPERPPTELVQKPPAKLEIENRAFDLTPRRVWTEIFVGSRTVIEAEQSGDRRLAAGLQPLVGRIKPELPSD